MNDQGGAGRAKKRLPKELADPFFEKLTDEFVEDKIGKLGCCAHLYLCCQKNYVDQLLILQDREDVQKNLEHTMDNNGYEFDCELERVMKVEADELIRKNYETI